MRKRLYLVQKKDSLYSTVPGYIRSAGLAKADPGIRSPSVFLGTAAPLRAQAPRISFIQLKMKDSLSENAVEKRSPKRTDLCRSHEVV
jgi:hypothetical protein